MELLKAYSENIYSYPKLDLQFQYSGGVTLILGKNLDQKTSNGSGKTTILKIIYFLIYGSDLNDANLDSIPNRTSDGGYYGYVIFKESGHTFKIERLDRRKDKHPQKLSSSCINFYIDDVLFMTTVAKKDSPQDIQLAINSKIKMSPKLFTSSILSRRSSNKNFLMANDTEKKEILSEILDLTSYGKAFELIKKDISEIEKRRKEKQIRIESLNEQINSFKENISEQESLVSNFLNEKEEKLKQKKLIINKEKSKYVAIKAKIVKVLDLKELNENKEKLEKLIAENQVLLNDEVSLAQELTKLESEKNQLLKEIKAIVLDPVTKKSIESILLKNSFDHELSNVSLKGLISLEKEISKSIETFSESIINLEKKLNIEDKKYADHLNKLNINKNNLQNELKTNNAELSRISQSLKEISESNNCPTCLRDYDENHKKEHIQPKIDNLTSQIKSLNFTIQKLTKQIDSLEKEIEEFSKNLNDYSTQSTTVSSLNQKVKTLKLVIEELTNKEKIHEDGLKLKNEKESNLESIEKVYLEKKEIYSKFDSLKTEQQNLTNSLKEVSQKITENTNQVKLNQQYAVDLAETIENGARLEKEYKELEVAENPYIKIIENLTSKINGLKVQIETFNKSILADDEEMYYLKFWAIGFSPAGIRSFISDDLIDLLNQKVQEHLNDLFNGALGILFESESENSKGVSVNKISTLFFLNGREVEKETLSDGQINRCVLATDLALMEVAESRSGTLLNVKFLDEPCANIDSAGQLLAFRLFNKLAKQKDGFFVISHDESFQSMCANTIHVLYKNENSRIVSKEEFVKNSYSEDDDSNVFEKVNSSGKHTGSSDFLKEIVFKKKKRETEEED